MHVLHIARSPQPALHTFLQATPGGAHLKWSQPGLPLHWKQNELALAAFTTRRSHPVPPPQMTLHAPEPHSTVLSSQTFAPLQCITHEVAFVQSKVFA